MEMRLARILALVGAIFGAIFGGMTACNDHNPTVVFTVDVDGGGKSEAGISQDRIMDGSTPLDAGVDRAVDWNPVVDGLAPIDGNKAGG
jgi:hypothetical protein